MDREKARFVLRSFRPDGADAADAEFAEALALAAADRELGEWLARERAADAEFSAALNRLALPEDLRSEILAGLAGDREVEPCDMDEVWSRALMEIRPPDGLREEILMAMQSSVATGISRPRMWRRFAVPLAAAAGIALALILTRPDPDQGKDQAALTQNPAPEAVVPVTITRLEQQAIAELESPGFTLDLKNPDHEVLFRHIREHGAACPQGCLPPGLKDIPGIGCRTIDVGGKRGAIVCFRRAENDIVHMVVFRQRDVRCKLPACGSPKLEKRGDWAVAKWQEGGRVFLLLGHSSPEHLDEVF
jgi:hypothetical protein